MHKTRNEMPNEWPIARKGTKYLALTSHANAKSISILFVLREMLGIVQTRKEAKYIMRNKEVKINGKARKDENFPVQVFDTIVLEKINKNLKLIIENGKYKLEEISAKEAEKKIVKISGKKILDAKTIQMNLEDGQNFNTKESFSLGDSAVVNTKENKVEKILSLKIGAKVEIVSGKYAGQQGKVKELKELTRGKDFIVQLKDKEVSIPLKTLLVIE